MAGLFDIFSSVNAQDAANAQIAGINAGQSAATNALTTNATSALAPLQTNYGQAQGGVNQLLTALGIGGAGGAAGGQAIQSLLANTPGYQFQLNQGNQNVLRNAAATGTTASGATLNALQQQGQGLADSTYQQFISNLQPFLGASAGAAGGIANTYTGLGNSLANLDWTASTSKGNANANADLANNQASANMFNLLQNGLSTAASFAAPLMLSDARAKTDIEPIGELFDGTNVYRFKYHREIDPSQKTHVGLMAQEVEQSNPGAVKEFAGVKFVDYAKATERAKSTGDMVAAFLKAA